jgi:hypothetical protein
MKRIAIASLLLAVVLLSGCNNALNFEGLEDVFYEAAKDTLPTFESNKGIHSKAVTTWDLGDPIYELYGILNDGEPVGYFNVYDLLKGADDRFNALSESGSNIPQQPVKAPLDVGFNDETDLITYNTYYEYSKDNANQTFGYVDENDVVYMLHSRDQGRGEKLIVQGWYDEGTQDVAIGMFMANKVDDDWEIVRAFVEGNTEDNEFAIKVIRDGYAYDHNITGYGKSKGSDNYFLMKIANDTMDFSNAVYYTMDAEASISDLQAMDAAGSSSPVDDSKDYDDKLPDAYDSDVLPSQSEVDDLDMKVSYDQ